MAAPQTKSKKVHGVHMKPKVFRQHDANLTVLQWGVDHMMHELSSVSPPGVLMERDFRASSKVGIHNQHYNDQHLPEKFKVKEYCPLVFRNLRDLFGMSEEDYLDSMCNGEFSEMRKKSKKGVVLYFSYDFRVVIKRISKDQVQNFHATFMNYHMYVNQFSGQTLLPRYYGMYRVTIEDKDQYFLIMHNIRSCALETHVLYDLKGSSVDRNASEKELIEELPILKDNDFRERQKVVPLHQERTVFIDTLKRDVAFLTEHRLMDYTLLICIHEIPEGEEAPEVDRAFDLYHIGELQSNERQLFFIGIVDVLTFYRIKKKAAHAVRTAAHAGKSERISTVNPESYGKRLLEFVESVVL